MDRPVPLPFTAVLTGVSFRQDEVVMLKEEQSVRIIHEPENPYDSNACSVYTDSGGMVGFIPAGIVSRLVARGEGAWRGHVVEVRRGDTWGVSITVDTPLDPVLPEVPAEAPLPEKAPKKVYARSGRELGVYVRAEENKIVVRAASGVEIPYPKDLVTASKPQ